MENKLDEKIDILNELISNDFSGLGGDYESKQASVIKQIKRLV